MKKENMPMYRAWLRRFSFIFADSICVFVAYLCTLSFRFGGAVPADISATFYDSILYILFIYFVVNMAFKLYESLWEHASIEELVNVVLASVISTVLCYTLAALRMDRMPRSVYIAAGLVIILLHGGIRMTSRVLKLFMCGRRHIGSANALIIGAGEAGAIIISSMQENPAIKIIPVAIVDDDERKRLTRIHGVKVMGTTADIPALVKRLEVTQIIYAMPSASGNTRKRVLEICASTGCEIKIIPSVEKMLFGHGSTALEVRDVDVGDLLDRPETKLDIDAISGYLKGGTILVTGGGGSIGSELCRQIARFEPKKLVVFDMYENNAYELYMEMKQKYEKLDMDVVIGSVRDIKRLDTVFGEYKPDVVFHAAAHKHVPLMEQSPAEAIKNNVDGTFNVAMAADIAGTKRFVLISSDKAVNPVNVMGASKYLCELIVQYMNKRSTHTDYVAVRFGNVLGSNGSVIPLFRRQIASGGPVTVTHKDIVRYFMTIPEAAQLVIQAGSMANQGEIFLLDMGQPVRIDDFARQYIRLAGYEPDTDIQIVYTGLRPGEKMYEELMQQDETQVQSGFPGILVCKAHAIEPAEIKRRIDYIRKATAENPLGTREYLSEIIPTFHDAKAPEQSVEPPASLDVIAAKGK